VSLNGNFMYSNNAQSYIWFDADTNIFRSCENSMYQFKEFTFYVDPSVKYLTSKGGAHSFRNRILFSNSNELAGDMDSQSMMVFDEYQYNKTFNKIGMTIIAGACNQYATSYGPVFNGDGDPHAVEGEKEPSAAFSNNMAIYAQLEQKFFKKRNLTVQLGGRWEFYNLWGDKIDSEKKNKPIFRIGANYQVPATKTSFRASFGQGYRFPTIGEKFISLTVGDYGFYPNPQLKPETSWNAEAGIMQPFMFFDFRGMVDLCYFHQDYDNFIEFSMGGWGSSKKFQKRFGYKFLNFGPTRMVDLCYFHQDYDNFIEFSMGGWGSSKKFQKRFGYKFLNFGPTKVNGIDFALMGEGKITKHIRYTLMAAYTWSNPTTKDRSYVYFVQKNQDADSLNRNFTFLNSSSDTTRNVLKYRIEHMVKLDIEFTFFKKFALGGTLNYYSAMRNVDKFMFSYDANNPTLSDVTINNIKSIGDLPFYNFYNFFHDNKKGSITLDLRASYYFEKLSISFLVKNTTNHLYALRPLYAEPPRTYTLQLIFKI